MIKLNYYIHLLLISKYRLFINLFIISIIYLSFYGGKIAYCMNENTNFIATPAIAESKSLASNSTLAKDILITEQQKQIEHFAKAAEVGDTVGTGLGIAKSFVKSAWWVLKNST